MTIVMMIVMLEKGEEEEVGACLLKILAPAHSRVSDVPLWMELSGHVGHYHDHGRGALTMQEQPIELARKRKMQCLKKTRSRGPCALRKTGRHCCHYLGGTRQTQHGH